MNPVITLIIAIAVTVFHFWASRRSPKYWFLGGIVPALWIGIVVFLFANDAIDLRNDWAILLFPTVILLLIWIVGHEAAKKRELHRRKAKDI